MPISREKDSRASPVLPEHSRCRRTIVFESSAAYNRDALPMPKPNGPNGRRVLNLEMLLNHAFYWDWLNEQETEEVLMELYIARTRRAQ